MTSPFPFGKLVLIERLYSKLWWPWVIKSLGLCTLLPVIKSCGIGSHATQSAAALRSSAWLLEHISAQAPLLSLGDERSKQLFQKLVDNYHRARQLIAESLGVSDERGFAAHVPLAIDPTPQGLAMSARRASRWIGPAL